MDEWSVGWWIAMVLMMAVMALAIVVAVWLLARPLSRWAEGRRERDPALDELRGRYARGEIGDEEFAERKRRLDSS